MKYCPTCNAKYDDSVSFCAADGEVLEDDPSTLVGSTLDGQYHIEVMLGKGGMGAVYRARHILLGDRVAIKVLPPQMRNNAEWLRRFRREGQAARRFRHPNAVTVYDLRTTSDGLIYMVMEYVEGHTLDAELKRRGRFTPTDAFTVLEPIMSVLNSAHAMGVVHRDLKPENIMLGKPGDDGQPVTKLLDLGIAKMREVAGADAGGTTALTIAGQVLGTPFYMSPEQWGEVPRDGNVEIDGRADIYSLGVVFYELIQGRRPFTGLTLQELRRDHVSTYARPLSEALEGVPEPFARAIARAMSKDRADRQATAGELAAELRAALGLPAASSSSPSLNLSSGTHNAPPSTPTNVGGGETSLTASDHLNAPGTNSEVIGPTIVTVDAPPRQPQPQQSQPDQYQGQQPPPLAATSLAPQFTPQPTEVYSQAQGAPSFPSFDAQQPPYGATQGEPARRSSKTPLIIAVAAVLLIGGGVGGWLLLSNRGGAATSNNGGANKTANNGNTGTSNANNGGSVAAGQESLNYWLEVAEAGPNGDSARVAGVVPLASGQSFKIHFRARQDGYVYIIGPGEDSKPTTFLTDAPVEGSGVESNRVKRDEEFVFPEDVEGEGNEEGQENWITLDKKPQTEIYTIIFSPSPLTDPDFLSKESGRSLSAAEVRELDEFRSKYKANAPSTDVINGGGTEPLVSVKIPAGAPAGEPVIFDLRIEHK